MAAAEVPATAHSYQGESGEAVAGSAVNTPAARRERRRLQHQDLNRAQLLDAAEVVFGSKGKAAPENMPIPDKFKLTPEGTPTGQAMNVAQAYARYADAEQGAGSFDTDFDAAVVRHRLIDAIERSSAEGKSIKL